MPAPSPPSYVLLTDPEPFPGLRPSYTHGNRTGTAGRHALSLAFASHPFAITTIGAPRMPYAPYRLTPADICDLRLSIPRARVEAALDAAPKPDTAAPYILYLPADDTFCLIAYSRPRATSKRPEVLAACLRNERAEPGFIRRVLDPSWTVEEASLDPASARLERKKREAYSAEAKLRQTEADEARRQRRLKVAVDATQIDLDDLFTP